MSNSILPQIARDDKWISFADTYRALKLEPVEWCDGLWLFCQIPDSGKFDNDEIAVINKSGYRWLERFLNPFHGVFNPTEMMRYLHWTSRVGKQLFNQPNPGFIYLAMSSDGLYKIGYSKNVTKRMKSLQANSRYRITHIHDFFTVDCTVREAQLHRRFMHRHVYGEWFSLSNSDVEIIKAMKDE